MMKSKLILLALGLAGALGGGTAMAHDRDDVQWSVTIASQGGAPVYGAPAPVYGYGQPAYGYGQPVYAARAYGYRQYHRPTRWDVDGDGIPNRYDRLYNPAWDRDGDGIPDWREGGHRGWRR